MNNMYHPFSKPGLYQHALSISQEQKTNKHRDTITTMFCSLSKQAYNNMPNLSFRSNVTKSQIRR